MIKFFEITYSIDKQITGCESQINDFFDKSDLTKEMIDLYQDNRKNTFINEKVINLNNFSLDRKSKMTDILSSNYLRFDGFFISKKLREIIKDVKVHNFKTFEITIYKNGIKIEDYCFINIIDTKSINYQKTIFRIDSSPVSWRDGGKKVEINSEEELFSKAYDVIMDDPTMIILPKKAILNEYVDIIKLANSNSIFCSEKFRQKIEEEGLKGMVFKETDIEFYLEE